MCNKEGINWIEAIYEHYYTSNIFMLELLNLEFWNAIIKTQSFIIKKLFFRSYNRLFDKKNLSSFLKNLIKFYLKFIK